MRKEGRTEEKWGAGGEGETASDRMPAQFRKEREGYGNQIQEQKDEALGRQHWLQLTVENAVQETERKFRFAIYYQCTNALSKLHAKLENTTYPIGLL